MVRRSVLLVVLALALVLLASACSGRGGVSISVYPHEVTLAPGGTQEFTASVQGAREALVDWSASGGELVASGSSAVFTAPAEVGEYTVTARSARDRGRYASAVVSVEASGGESSYPYDGAVPLGDESVEFAHDGVRVVVPAAREGAKTSVEMAVVDEAVGVAMPLSVLTRVVALRFSGDLDLVGAVDDEAPVLRLALELSGVSSTLASASAGDMDDASKLALAWVRVDEGPWAPLGTSARWDSDAGTFDVEVSHPLRACADSEDAAAVAKACEFVWQVVDASALVAAENSIDLAAESSGLSRASTMPTATGMYSVDLDDFVATGESCDIDALQAFLTHDNERANWTRSARTAVVFVHGWMSLAGWLEGLAGDEPLALPAHCSTWQAFFSGLAGAGGPWASLRENVDVFAYRYNSNQRIGHNGASLAGWLLEMQDLGYERVVLVAHSMGGLVAHDARDRVLLDGRSGFGTIDLPVITLATPYMGGPLLCVEVEGGFCQDADTSSLAALWGSVPVSGMPSTLDMASALRITDAQLRYMGHTTWLGRAKPYEPNPYLLQLWERVNMRDPNLTVFLGSSGEWPFYSDATYAGASLALLNSWGINDGVVPVASAVGAVDFEPLFAVPRFTDLRAFGRDHGYMTMGCGERSHCPSGVWTTDVYLDEVADQLLAYSLLGDSEISVLVEPGSAALAPGAEQPFTATVIGASDTSVTWVATCGSVPGTGNTITYTAPDSPGPCLVTATSVADPAVSATARVTVRSGSELALVSLDGDLAVLEADGSLTSVRDTPATLTHGVWDAGRTSLLITERITDSGSDHRVLEFADDGSVVADDRVLLVPPPAAGAWSRSFGWHPDGVSVLYREREMRHCDHTSVMRRYPDGTETVFLDPAWVGDVIVYSLDIHPNGREVLWTSQVGCWSPTLAVFRADLVDGAVDVDSIEVLLDDGQHVDFARFSPDGSLIAFMRSDASRGYNGPENLYVMNVDGSGVRALTNNSSSAQRVRTLAWSADSETLLFSMSTDTGSTYEVYEASVSEPGAVQLTNASGRALVLDW